MKPLVKRIRWNRIGYVFVGILVVCSVSYGYYRDTVETELVEYHETVSEGDTLWGICGRIATDKEDMGKLVWQTMQDNHIENPGNLQPGTVIVIRAKKAREL